MYVETVPNRNSRPAVLLREGWREGERVRKRTLANLTDWSAEKVASLRRVLKGQRLVNPEDAFTIERSLPHGHVNALLAMTRRLGLDRLIAPKRSPERDRVLAMVVQRLLHPASKLATPRRWHTTTLAQELDLGDADEDALDEAMDWLLARQERIERRLAQRHLHEGAPVFADVSGSDYEGRTCPLMRFGDHRDGKRAKPQVVYTVLSAPGGCPVAVQASPGNTADPNTVADQVVKLREHFGLERIAREAARRTRTPLDAAQLGHKVGRVIARHKPAPESHRGMAKHFRWAVHDGRLVYERDHARIDAEARLDGIYVLAVSPPRGSPHKTRCAPTRDWPTSNAGSAPSKGSTSGCAPSATASNAGSARICSSACSPATWNGTCAAPGRRCCSTTRPWPTPGAPATPSPRPSPPSAPGTRKHPGVATTDGPFTASIPCSANSRPAAATPVGSPPTPRPRPCLCSPSRHRFSVAPHTSSKRSQYRELPKAEKLTPDQTVETCPAQGTSG